MKRGGPLKRRTPLRAKKGLDPGKPLERRTPLKQGKPLRARRPEPVGELERRLKEEFRRDAISRLTKDSAGRLVCPCCGKAKWEQHFDAHHVLRKEAIKKYVASLMLPVEEAREYRLELLWSKRNSLAICKVCHQRHTVGKERLPRRLLTRLHFAFACEIGLDYILDREYGPGP